MKITNMRCEYSQNPQGIDVPRPSLSWQLDSDLMGARQTAYQIIVFWDSSSEHEIIWDSGKVESDQSIFVEYDGPALTSRQRVSWQVRVWDQAGAHTGWSESDFWEMGLLQPEDWIAQWIGSPFVGGPRTTIPVPFLRKVFTIGASVTHARLYITALGVYEARLNGQRIGNAELAPGWTDYKKRVRYQVYDVTGLLLPGENMLGVILGDGWFCGHLASLDRQVYGDRPRLLAQLEMTMVDGSRKMIISDGSWETSFGPILESDLIMGESYDARLEFTGWDLPARTRGDRGGLWLPVEIFPPLPGMKLEAQRGPLVKRHEEFVPISGPVEFKVTFEPTLWVFDLGQNMVGRVRLKVNGPTGTTIRLRYAEMLNPDGTLYLANLLGARATDYYTLKGDPNGEVYEPRFTYHGFRYVEVAGYPGIPSRDAITGVVLHSENPNIGSFECSDAQLNQLQHNIQWGWKGNSLDLPTDCPQRDERCGWTGDAQVFCRTATYLTDAAGFFAKWLQDIEDGQDEQGKIPCVAPNIHLFNVLDGSPAWADASVIVPWTMYMAYGDKRLLAEHYGMMTRFVDYLIQTSPGCIRGSQIPESEQGLPAAGSGDWWVGGLGDWLADDGSGKAIGGTPKDLIGTAYLAYDARLLSQIASALGKTADVERYELLYQDVRSAFQKRFFTPDGMLSTETQTSYVLALQFDLLPPQVHQQAAAALVNDILKREMHLSTGFVGTSFLPFVLTNVGRSDVAYDLLFQQTWPSWLYAVTQGATTIWESWDGWTLERGFQEPSRNSFNHYAYGSIGAWLYSVIAGINPDWEQPAYKHIVFRPLPGGNLTYAKASLQSPYGRVASEWHIAKGEFALEVAVPPNTTATVYLPGEVFGQEVAAGNHRFSKAWLCFSKDRANP